MKPEPWLTLTPCTTLPTARLMSAIWTATFLPAQLTNSLARTWACFMENVSTWPACSLKVRSNTNAVPQRWEWGTLNHECIAGITACVNYLADLGRRADPSASTRRSALLAAYNAIQQHERELMQRLIPGSLFIHRLKLYGIHNAQRFI